MATHSSILAWRIPWVEEPGGLQSRTELYRVVQSRIRLNWLSTQKWSGLVCCSYAHLFPTLWDSMDCSMPGFSVPHCLLELAQTHVHQVSDAIQPAHPFPPSAAFNLSQHQDLF